MPHFHLYQFSFYIQVPFLFWTFLPLIQTFLFYSPMSIFTLLPIPPSRRTVSRIPYPPLILTKHHTWYSNDADFFISICGILFGLHHTYFSQSCYFQSIMDVAKPEWPAPKGSQALYPIPFNCYNFSHILYFSFTLSFCFLSIASLWLISFSCDIIFLLIFVYYTLFNAAHL